MTKTLKHPQKEHTNMHAHPHEAMRSAIDCWAHHDIVTTVGAFRLPGLSPVGRVKMTATVSQVQGPEQVPGPVYHITMLEEINRVKH